MKTENLHTLVGAGVVFVTLALAIVLMSGDDDHSTEDGYRLTATFSKTDGVGIGSEVLLAGIPVGVVISEEMDSKNHQVTLTMRMDDEIELPIDSGAQITSNGIFGSKYISINVGGDFEVLEDGDAFEFIRDSVIFEEVFESVIKMGEAGYQKRKEAAEKAKAAAGGSTTNIFATDPSLLGGDNNATNQEVETDSLFDDPQDEDIFDEDSSLGTETINKPINTNEGEGPL